MAMASVVNTLLFLAILLPSMHPIEAQIGVCYGKYARTGDNLPSDPEVVGLYERNGIGSMRIYDRDESILQAVKGSNIKLIIAVPNADIQSIGGSDQSAATQFVQQYVIPYASNIKYIAVGNEVAMGSPEASLVGPAMQNVLKALNAANLGAQIKVTTAIGTSLVVDAYPPSNGRFSNLEFMTPVANFLAGNGSPLLLNVYTYYAYADPGNTKIPLDYALLTSTSPSFIDQGNGLPYSNLFDALVDATYAALSKATTLSSVQSNSGGSSTKIVGSETGWSSSKTFPSANGYYYPNTEGGETPGNAETYYRNIINHAKQGTPLKPGPMEIYLYEMFDEGKKGGDTDPAEKNFGLFHPDGQPKYQLNFS